MGSGLWSLRDPNCQGGGLSWPVGPPPRPQCWAPTQPISLLSQIRLHVQQFLPRGSLGQGCPAEVPTSGSHWLEGRWKSARVPTGRGSCCGDGGPVGVGGLSEEPREVGNRVLGTGVGVLESHQGIGHCWHISPQKGQAGAWAASKPGNTRIFGGRGEVRVDEAKEEGADRGHSGLVWAPYGEGLSPPEALGRQPWEHTHSLTSVRLPGSLVRPLGPQDTPGH